VRRPRLLAAPLAAALLSLPAIAAACAACGVGNGRNTMAFFITTIFLSLLPLAFIGGLMLWIARNSRSFIAGEFRESDEPPVAAAPEDGAPRS
jgi:hypothetical protein